MTNRTRPLRTLAVSTIAAAVLAVGACASSPVATIGPDATTAGTPPTSQDTPTAAPTLPLRAGESFVDLKMSEPYTPSPPTGGTDEYRCLIVDPHLTTSTFLTGSQFRPGNTPIAHHAIVFAVPPEAAAAARSKDAATPGQGWTCFGDTGLGGFPAWVDTWTPGATETLLQDDVGFPLEPGSLLVLQIHYNLLATDGRAGEKDQSSVRLRLRAGTAATKPLITLPLPAPIELPCASSESGPLCDRAAAVADVTQRFGAELGGMAGELLRACGNGTPAPGDTQHCDIPIQIALTVYAAFGHMHLLGRSIKVELNPETARAQTLLDVPKFDFDNQRLVPMPKPVQVKPGDTVRVTCTHDATLRGQLPQLSKLPPRYVVWGDGTSDEMCLGLLTVALG